MIVDTRPRPSSFRSSSLGVLDVGPVLRRLDWVLLVAAATLVAYGLWAIGGITRFDVRGNPDYYVVRQAIAAALGVGGMLVAIAIPPSVYQRHWRFLYGGTIGAMVFVFVFAEAVRGSKRWIDLGPFQFQPSEFGKLLFVLAIAGFMVERGRRVGEISTVLTAIGLGLMPMVLVFLQPDLGSALVYVGALAGVLFLSGVRWLHLAVLGCAALFVVASVLWFLPSAGVQVLKPYQTARLTGFTNPDSDPGDLTYNVTQSRTAVGAGGLSGRGVEGASQTRLDYLPEHATDFVFASLAEQRGFVGTSILLLLYLLVVWRGLRVVTVAGRSLRGGRGRRHRHRVPVPGVRERRDDDGHRAGDRHSAPVRHGRRLVDGRESSRDRRAAVDPCSRDSDEVRLMPAGIGIGQLLGLVRDVRGSEEALARITVSGSGARELATALLAGGDARAVTVTETAVGQAVTIRLVEGEPTPEERLTLRRLAREQAPVIVVRRGGSGRIPHVLADDVVESGDELDIDAIAAAIARAAAGEGPSLAARLPVLRPAVSRRLIATTAITNAALAASSRLAEPQLPLLALAQARMLLLLGVARGETLPRDPQALALAAGPSLAVALGAGLGARACVRRLPMGGPLVRAAVAYGATRALGTTLLRREGGLSVRTGS